MKAPVKGYSRELQVGLFIVTAILIVAAFSFRITSSPILQRGTTLVAFFDDAVGLYINGKVKLAGISVGNVDKIELEGGRAKVTMRIDSQYDIPRNAMFVPRALNIMGDKFIEIIVPEDSQGPGSKEPSSSENPSGKSSWLRDLLIPGAYAQQQKKGSHYKDGEVVQSQTPVVSLDDISRQMGKVSEDLKATSDAIRKIVEGEPDPKTSLGRTLIHLEKTTKNLDEIASGNKSDLRVTIRSLKNISTKLDSYLKELDDNQIGKDIQALAQATGNMGKSVKRLDSILEKMDSGDGTIGKLINESDIGDELGKTLTSVNRVLLRSQQTNTIVDFSPEYHFQSELTKTYVGLMLQPREDKGYLLQMVVDKNGSSKTITETVSVDGGPAEITRTISNEELKFRFSLQYYKRIWDWIFRFGIFENSGGLAVEYSTLSDSLLLGTEFFDFGRESDQAHIRSYFKADFLRHFYFKVGVSDLLSQNNMAGLFVGAGLSFNDEDLGTLLSLNSLR